MKKRSKNIFEYLINPVELLQTKKVLSVNPTVPVLRNDSIQSKITVYEYNKDFYESKTLSSIEEAFVYTRSKGFVWINIDGIKKSDVEKMGEIFHIHPLLVEDILSVGQRPKFDELDDVVFCLLNMLYFSPITHSIDTEQVSMALTSKAVITFQEDASRDVFQPLRERLLLGNSRVRLMGADFLFYFLLDLIVDNYFVVLESLGGKIEDLEEEVIHNSNNKTLSLINALRKEMILLKRNVVPVREVIGQILRSETDLIQENTEKYFKDIYDHIVQVNDLSENYRDLVVNLHDLNVNNINLKMNEVMKVMAVVTCLMAPATVIGGIFGMNFERIPLLHSPQGFYISMGLMIIIPLIMIFFFKRRGWF